MTIFVISCNRCQGDKVDPDAPDTPCTRCGGDGSWRKVRSSGLSLLEIQLRYTRPLSEFDDEVIHMTEAEEAQKMLEFFNEITKRKNEDD